MPGTDVLLVSLGSTAGLRAADDELAGALRRAGASVAVAAAAPPREVRTLALTDLGWARAARARGGARGIAAHDPRAVVYCTTTAALLWPRPGAIRFDAPAAANRPGRHGVWQRPLERRRLRAGRRCSCPRRRRAGRGGRAARRRAVVVPIPVEPSGPAGGQRDIAAITYAAEPAQEGPGPRPRRVGARRGATARSSSSCGTDHVPAAAGVRATGALAPGGLPRAAAPRARLRHRARGARTTASRSSRRWPTAARSSPTPAPGPYAALPIARALDARLVGDDLAGALRTALDDPAPGYAARALAALAPYRRAAVDATVRDELLPRAAQRAPVLRSAPNSSHGRVLATSAAVSQARRAVATPQRVFGRRVGAVGVGVDEDRHARPRAASRACTSLRSRRSGAELISSIVPVRAAPPR